MKYTEKQARDLIIEAGHLLLEKKLTARTWGNISARLGDNEFIITPSGLGYEDLRPEQLVKVRIDDLSYEGELKPSSEKGIHAAVYALREGVDFIIHTHQFYASAVCAAEEDTDFAPCAGYGLPGTKKLREAVAVCVAAYPEYNAFLMAKHGALCLGSSMEAAFDEADRLEANCKALFECCVEYPKLYASSDSRFGLERQYGAVRRCDEDLVMAMSGTGRTLRPFIDDFAQMIGVDVKCVMAGSASAKAALKGRNAVLLTNEGALCAADNEDDAEAVEMILEKNCAAAMFVGGKHPLSPIDAALQRAVYLTKYSKLKNAKH